MKLPRNEVGPTDIIGYGECPSRFAYGMRRWTEGSDPPEAKHPKTMYGSAVHHMLHAVEADVLDDDSAVQAAFDAYAPYLDPEDMEQLKRDLAVYREREFKGVRLLLNEGEIRVPLLKHEGETIYLRGKIDRLYQRVDRPEHLIHVDYKSSRWYKAPKEIHADPQLWLYNWLLTQYFPECQRLEQIYDQLLYGRTTTTKTDVQRERIREWAIHQVKAILADEELAPRLNDWCAWCGLVEVCPEPKRATEFAAARLAVLAPTTPESDKKLDLDPDLMEFYVTEMERLGPARKAIEVFEEQVRSLLKRMPQARRAYFGYELTDRGSDVWSPAALRAAHELMGDDFYALIRLTKTRIDEFLGADKERKSALLDMAERVAQQPQLRKIDG